MTKSDPDRQTRALAGFVEDHREVLKSYAGGDRQTADIAEALIAYTSKIDRSDQEADR